jgi:hypothetical protein
MSPRSLGCCVAIVVGLSYGCVGGDVGLTRPTPRVMLKPDDLTSNAAQSPIRVVVDNGTIFVGRGILETLAKEVSLVDWPAMAEKVPVSITLRESTGETQAPSGDPRNDPGYIDVTPSVPLADRWYFFRVASLPSPLSWTNGQYYTTVRDGARGVRFNPASDPVLKAILRCPKLEEEVVYIELSEAVSVSSGLITLDRAGTTACPLVLEYPRAVVSHGLRCPGGLFVGSQATLTFSPDLKATSGKPLRVPNTVEILTPDRFKPDPSGCTAIRIDW